jgi:hypothetical protein
MTQVHSSHPRPFSTIADDFVTRYASRHQRPKTLTETRRYIDQHLKPAWGDMDIRGIGKPQVFAVLDAMMDRGTEVSATAGHKYIQSLSKIKRRLDRLSEVVDWRYHDIRRTVATAFGDELALPPHIAEAVQNRRSGIVSGVVAIYNRAQYEQAKREALEAWGAWLEAATVNPPPYSMAIRARV